jgi:hypothetical protein
VDAIHILLRIPLKDRQIADVVRAHQSVIDQHGAVWLGVAGRTLLGALLERINEQIQTGTLTFVYLVQRHKKSTTLTFFRGRIQAASNQFPANESDMVPSYYASLERNLRSWLKVQSLLPFLDSGDTLIVESTGNSASWAVTTGMASVLFVTRKDPMRQ